MYQPLITFCPHPAIFTQVLTIFVLALAVIAEADILIDESVLAFILDTKSGKFHYH